MLRLTHKKVLVRLLAQENIRVIVDPTATTASFDLSSRAVRVPDWDIDDENVVDLFLGHEASHGLHTPPQGWHDAVDSRGRGFRSYLNVIEDARIERLICIKFPGLKRSFVAGYDTLIKRGFFGVQPTDPLDHLPLIDRINLYTKLGSLFPVNFTSEEYNEFVVEIDKLTTWADVVRLATKLYDRQKELNEKEREAQSGDDDGSSNKAVCSSRGNKPNAGCSSDQQGGEGTDDTTDTTRSDDDDTVGDNEGDIAVRDEEGDREADETPESPSGEGITSVTDDAYRDCVKQLPSDENRYVMEYEIVTQSNVAGHIISSSRIDELVKVPLNKGMSAIKKFTTDYKPLIDKYVSEFNRLRAGRSNARIAQSRIGQLDPRKLHEYRYNDDIFLQSDDVYDSTDHGFIFMIDWSGSTSSFHYHIAEQAITLASFCRAVGIPFVTYAFVDTQVDPVHVIPYGGVLGKLRLIELFSSKQTPAQHNTMSSIVLCHMNMQTMAPDPLRLGGTPLNNAVHALFNIVPDFQKATRVGKVNVFFITDGVHASGKHLDFVHDTTTYTDRETRAMTVVRGGMPTGCMIGEQCVVSHLVPLFVLVSMLRDRFQCDVFNYFLTDRVIGHQVIPDLFVCGKYTADDVFRAFDATGSGFCVENGGFFTKQVAIDTKRNFIYTMVRYVVNEIMTLAA